MPLLIHIITTTIMTLACCASSFELARPVLEQHCISCHGPDKAKGGLRLHTLTDFNAGGDDHPSINHQAPKTSHLLKLISLPHDHDDKMPSKGRMLTADEIDALSQWYADKAPWPKGAILQARKPQPSRKELTHQLEKIIAFPNKVTLETAADFHTVLSYGHYSDASNRDLSSVVKLHIDDPKIAQLDGLKVLPLSDGTTTLHISFAEHKTQVPIRVIDAKKQRPISFQLDVMPVITAAGCNTGSCHGSARGQDGFQLSLFGFDPKGDYQRITRELPGRRLNLAIPQNSLFLTKAAGQVPHTGGKILTPESTGYRTILAWIDAGAHYDKDDIPSPISIDISPKQLVHKGSDTEARFSVRARYSDGTDRDVTPLSTFTTSNDNSVTVDSKTATATSANRGEAFIMARFHTFTEGSQSIVIPAKQQLSLATPSANNYIDTHIHNKLKKLRITPAELCSDEVFIRRVYLDIIGKLPTTEQRRIFLLDATSDKRIKLIDHLLSQPEFTDIWVMKWAELLQIRTFNNQVSYKAATLYHAWLREQIAAKRPFNLTVKELLSSRGGTFSTPSTNFYQVERDNLKLSENVAQVFMGTRLQCAQCHNHPFDKWTMDDYYGFAAFFAQVKRKKAEDPREQIIYDGSGDITHPVTQAKVAPRFLGGTAPAENRKKRRENLAEWLTAPDNPYFSRNLSNIIWEHFLGRGIVHPVDDVRTSNPPSNPALLDDLSQHLIGYDYDFRKLIRDICSSRTYQLSTQTNRSNQSDLTNFSHATPRRIRAEILLDVISQVTNTPNKFKGLPHGAKAVSIADGNTSTYFLTTFGRSTRKTVCSCEVKREPNLSQALHLLNGNNTNERVSNGKVISKLLAKKLSNPEIINQLYLRTLTRPATPVEIKQLLTYFTESAAPKQRKVVLEDIFWALLNSKEFLFTH